MKNGKEEERLADLFVILSAVSVIFAALDFYGFTILLAATHWLLISIILMLWAIFIQIKE